MHHIYHTRSCDLELSKLHDLLTRFCCNTNSFLTRGLVSRHFAAVSRATRLFLRLIFSVKHTVSKLFIFLRHKIYFCCCLSNKSLRNFKSIVYKAGLHSTDEISFKNFFSLFVNFFCSTCEVLITATKKKEIKKPTFTKWCNISNSKGRVRFL